MSSRNCNGVMLVTYFVRFFLRVSKIELNALKAKISIVMLLNYTLIDENKIMMYSSKQFKSAQGRAVRGGR